MVIDEVLTGWLSGKHRLLANGFPSHHSNCIHHRTLRDNVHYNTHTFNNSNLLALLEGKTKTNVVDDYFPYFNRNSFSVWFDQNQLYFRWRDDPGRTCCSG